MVYEAAFLQCLFNKSVDGPLTETSRTLQHTVRIGRHSDATYHAGRDADVVTAGRLSVYTGNAYNAQRTSNVSNEKAYLSTTTSEQRSCGTHTRCKSEQRLRVGLSYGHSSKLQWLNIAPKLIEKGTNVDKMDIKNTDDLPFLQWSKWRGPIRAIRREPDIRVRQCVAHFESCTTNLRVVFRCSVMRVDVHGAVPTNAVSVTENSAVAGGETQTRTMHMKTLVGNAALRSHHDCLCVLHINQLPAHLSAFLPPSKAHQRTDMSHIRHFLEATSIQTALTGIEKCGTILRM